MTSLAAVATAVTALAGLVLYALKQRTSPASQYRDAVAAYEKAVQDEKEFNQKLRAELDAAVPDRALVAEYSDALRLARRRVQDARAARDRLRP